MTLIHPRIWQAAILVVIGAVVSGVVVYTGGSTLNSDAWWIFGLGAGVPGIGLAWCLLTGRLLVVDLETRRIVGDPERNVGAVVIWSILSSHMTNDGLSYQVTWRLGLVPRDLARCHREGEGFSLLLVDEIVQYSSLGSDAETTITDAGRTLADALGVPLIHR